MAEIIKCPACGGDVSSEAKSCPHCGHPVENQKKKGSGCFTTGLFVLVIVIVLYMVISSVQDSKRDSSVPSSQTESIESGKGYLTESDIHVAVKDFLKHNMNDWKSYESVSWGKPQEIRAGSSNPNYKIYHKFRGKNSSGVTMIEEHIFTVAYDKYVGHVINVE